MADDKSKSTSPGFQHNQSAEAVEEVRRRASREKSSQRAPNEMGQQPLQDEPEVPKKPRSPQQERETPRKEGE